MSTGHIEKVENSLMGLLKHIVDVALFKTGKRLSRGEYILSLQLINIPLILIKLFILRRLFNNEILYYILYFLTAFIFLALWFIPLTIKRLYDMGKRKWKWIYLLIPVINIYWLYLLYCRKGDEGENSYGKDPLDYQPKSNQNYRILYIILVVIAIGIGFAEYTYIDETMNALQIK